jgi:hypothetical protein
VAVSVVQVQIQRVLIRSCFNVASGDFGDCTS